MLDDPAAEHERRPAAHPLQRQGLLRHRRARAPRPTRAASRSLASSSSTRSRSTRSRRWSRRTRQCARSSGRRRSRRTWAPGGRSAIGSRRPRRSAPLAPASSTSGRTWRASTSEGYPTLHHYEQDRIVREALGFGPARASRRAVVRGAASDDATRGPFLPCGEHELLALLRRKPPPRLVHHERDGRRPDAPEEIDEDASAPRSASRHPRTRLRVPSISDSAATFAGSIR